jgi:hypothetical protein
VNRKKKTMGWNTQAVFESVRICQHDIDETWWNWWSTDAGWNMIRYRCMILMKHVNHVKHVDLFDWSYQHFIFISRIKGWVISLDSISLSLLTYSIPAYLAALTFAPKEGGRILWELLRFSWVMLVTCAQQESHMG